MIILRRLAGQPMAVNPDLIEKAEATPDTVITMVDGHKIVVSDSVAEVVEKVRIWRASVAAEAFVMSSRQESAGFGETPQDGSRPDHRHTGPARDDVQAAGAGGGGASMPLAQVLHLPAREE